MSDRVLALIVDESKWLTASLSLATICAATLVYRVSRVTPLNRTLALAAMNLFFGVTIGTMAFGHLLAVTLKFLTGTLVGSAPLLYLIGAFLAVPSCAVILHTRRLVSAPEPARRSTVIFNCWLGLSLLALGLHNLPLAVPAALNIGYHLHARRIVGRLILATYVAVAFLLFIGSLVFLASGQSFEQFSAPR